MSCNYFKEINYQEFAQPINKKLQKERIPLSAAIEITRRCNLRCVHCYCNELAADEQIKKKELSLDGYIKFLDGAAKRGCLFLLFTGGEPFLRDDFFDIYTYARKKGFIITIFTNAALIDEKISGFLTELPPHKMEVTLYGATRQVYESITQMPGSFEKCMAGIHNLIERKIPLGLKTMVSTLNKHELFKIKEFAKSLNLDFRFDAILQARLDGSKQPHKYRLNPDEIAQLDIADQDRLKSWEKLFDPQNRRIPDKRFYSCGAGQSMFFIDPYGMMSICSMVLEPAYDIREHGFDRIWDELFFKEVNREYTKPFKCLDCDISFYCQQCPGWSIIEAGEREAKIDYFCDIAKARKEKLSRYFKNMINLQ